MAPVFKDCVICSGKNKKPRNGDGGATCSAYNCKRAYTQRRAQHSTVGLGVVNAPPVTDRMPKGMWVHEIEEILGERCCEPHMMSKKKRKNGPGNAAEQEFLVRGNFLEEDSDAEDEDVDQTPEPNTFWVSKDELLETIAVEDVKDALKARHEAVVGDLE